MTVASILLSLRYFFNTLGYEVAIFLFLKLLNLEFSGAAIDSLHSENPRSRDFIIFFFLDNVFSIKTFSPTIAKSASPFETREGISSSLTKSISTGRLLDFASSLSALELKLIPDLLIKSLLCAESLPFFWIAIVSLLFIC